MPLTKAEDAELKKISAELELRKVEAELARRKQGGQDVLELESGGTPEENPYLARFKDAGVTKGPQGAVLPGNDIPLGKPSLAGTIGQNFVNDFRMTPVGAVLNAAGTAAQFGMDVDNHVNSAKNAFVNEMAKPKHAEFSLANAGDNIASLPADLARAGQAAYDTAMSGKTVSPNIVKASPESGLAAHLGAKALNFGFDMATDPANLVLGGKLGKLLNAGKLVDTAGKDAILEMKNSALAMKATEKIRSVVDPLSQTAAGASAIRGLGWFGIGPQSRMFKEVQSPYRQELDIQAQRVTNVLQDIQKHSIDIQRDPIVRAFIQDHAAVTKENPVIELVRDRMASMNKPGSDKTWEGIAARAKGFGVDPEFVRGKADELRAVYDDAQKVIIKANSGRKLETLRAKINRTEQQAIPDLQEHISDLSGAREYMGAKPSMLPEEMGYHTETAATQKGMEVAGKPDEQYQQFIDNVLGEKRPRNLTAKQRLIQPRARGGSADTQIVREAGVRNLIQDMPTKFPEWVQPVTDSIKPGWVAVPEGGLAGSMEGYQMPEALYNMLENETAAAGLGLSKQVRSEYIIAKDIGEALNKNVIGQIKKGFIGTSPTQTANLVANLGQQSIVLKDVGLKVGMQRRADVWKKAFKEAWELKARSLRSKTVEEMSGFSPSLLETSIDTAIGKPSPEFGQLPEVIGAGKYTMALPRPQGLTARVFGEGKGGTLAATAGKALGVVNPVEQLANFQGLAETATKIATYKLLREDGKLGAKEAVAMTEKVHFDYTDRSHAAEMADKFGLWIFNAYPQKAFSLFMDTVMNHPSELLRYKNLRHLAIGEDDPSKNLNLPDWMRKSKFTVPLGDNQYVNVGRFHPFGGVIDQLANLGQGVDVSEEARNMASKTIYNPAMNIIQGQQTFSRDERGNPPLLAQGQPKNELGGLQAKEAMKAYAPALMGGRAGQAFSEVRQGLGRPTLRNQGH
jgi:hypothetical protein